MNSVDQNGNNGLHQLCKDPNISISILCSVFSQKDLVIDKNVQNASGETPCILFLRRNMIKAEYSNWLECIMFIFKHDTQTTLAQIQNDPFITPHLKKYFQVLYSNGKLSGKDRAIIDAPKLRQDLWTNIAIVGAIVLDVAIAASLYFTGVFGGVAYMYKLRPNIAVLNVFTFLMQVVLMNIGVILGVTHFAEPTFEEKMLIQAKEIAIESANEIDKQPEEIQQGKPNQPLLLPSSFVRLVQGRGIELLS